jgi:hypothetical protein
LQKIGLISVEKKLSRTTKEILEALKEIGVEAALIEARVKGTGKVETFVFAPADDVLIYSLAGLKEIGIIAIETDFRKDVVSLSSDGLFNVGIFVARRVPGTRGAMLIFDVFKNLEEIANKAYEKNGFEDVRDSSLKYLWFFGAFYKNKSPDYAKGMASDFKKSNIHVMKDLFGSEKIRNKARDYVKNKFPGLIDELKGFEELYDKSDAISLKSD